MALVFLDPKGFTEVNARAQLRTAPLPDNGPFKLLDVAKKIAEAAVYIDKWVLCMMAGPSTTEPRSRGLSTESEPTPPRHFGERP